MGPERAGVTHHALRNVTTAIPKTELMMGQLAINRGLLTRNEAKDCVDDLRRRLADGGRALLGQVMTERGLVGQDQLEDLVASQRKINEQREQLAWAQVGNGDIYLCLLYTSPSPRDQRGSRMPSSA